MHGSASNAELFYQSGRLVIGVSRNLLLRFRITGGSGVEQFLSSLRFKYFSKEIRLIEMFSG